MSLIIIGEAATKVMDGYAEFTQAHAEVPWRSMRNMRNRMRGQGLATCWFPVFLRASVVRNLA